MKRIITLFFLGIVTIGTLQAQVKWLSFPEAVTKNEATPKKIFVDVYTEWCGWCKVMDNRTFSDSAVVSTLNKYYYTAKLDAESKETYKFSGYTFEYDAKSRANQLAIALLQGQMSYPSILFLDENNKLITVVPGYQKPEDLRPILLYLGQDLHKTTSYEDFLKTYKK